MSFISSSVAGFFASTGLVAGLPLALCATLAFAVFFERAWFLFVSNSSEDKRIQMVRECASSSFIENEIDVDIALIHLNHRLLRGLRVLKVIASLAPVLGLLGTILGITEVFESISHTTSSVSPAVISAGLRKAMFTTALGLVIAIPTGVVYHFMHSVAMRKLELCYELLIFVKNAKNTAAVSPEEV